MLTPAQIAHFEIFGFLLLRRIFTPAEIANITCEANQIWRDDLERQPDENPYQIVVPFVEERPRLAQLPEDDRIYLPIGDYWVRALFGVGRKATGAVSLRRTSSSGTPTGPISQEYNTPASRS